MLRFIICGIAGAAALTAAHQAVKNVVPDAPRMDALGMQGIGKVCQMLGINPPSGKALFGSALIGDLISNSIYYGSVGTSRGGKALAKGVTLGLAAGAGAVKLPKFLGLSEAATGSSRRQMALTVGLYLIGGIAAGLVAQILPGGKDD